MGHNTRTKHRTSGHIKNNLFQEQHARMGSSFSSSVDVSVASSVAVKTKMAKFNPLKSTLEALKECLESPEDAEELLRTLWQEAGGSKDGSYNLHSSSNGPGSLDSDQANAFFGAVYDYLESKSRAPEGITKEETCLYCFQHTV